MCIRDRVSDAICVVISEETGRISITDSGRLIPRLDVKRLRTILFALYSSESRSGLLSSPWARLKELAMSTRRENQKQV